MHDSVFRWIRNKLASLEYQSVLELGSRSVNGTPRGALPENDSIHYVGIDIEPGPGVDIVMSSWNLDKNTFGGQFDLVISTEMLEHDYKFWLTFRSIKKVLKKGGHLLLTTRGFHFQYHNPPDYYRFSKEVLRELCDEHGLEVLELSPDGEVSGWLVLATRR